ncbi:acetyltransferase [Litorivicinus lipolyticus]|uniref:acetyltransferase n=1 Tax=Litorivicinus lipolyticus TaxID=418701 RepID=UPI003B5CF1EA
MHLLLGVVSAVILVFLTIACGGPAAILGLIKLVFPATGKTFAPAFEWLVVCWSRGFTGWLSLFSPAITVEREGQFSRTKNYLIIANHQSWVDIFVLLIGTNRTIPSTRFFMKRELLWIPLVGFVAWSMDFPVMRRHSREYLAKHPEKRGSDLATVRAACAKFQQIPVSVVNFSEGTRSTVQKLAASKSQYTHILPPKAGGVATVLAAVGDHLDAAVDATIHYPDGVPTFWQWMCGRAGRMHIHMKTVELPEVGALNDNGQISAESRERVKRFLEQRWTEKDQRLGAPPA